MKFPTPLLEGKILGRRKRFLSDIQIGDKLITAHLANTGSMASCWEPNGRVLVSHHDNPSRKLKYSVQMTYHHRSWVGVNTAMANKLACEAIENGVISSLQGYETIRREVKTGDSRIDFLLESSQRPSCYVEVKSVTLRGEKGVAFFPDAVSTRGQKHLKKLTELVKTKRSVLLFVVQREDVNNFDVASHIDSTYARLAHEALDQGVEILVYGCTLSKKEIRISHALPFSTSSLS